MSHSDRKACSLRDAQRRGGTYHRRRRQIALGRLTPIEFEAIITTAASQAE